MEASIQRCLAVGIPAYWCNSVTAMLSDFIHTTESKYLIEMLDQFDIEPHKEKYPFILIEFQILSPDSFVWRLLIGSTVYYLYAEDYVSDLAYVHEVVSSYAVKNAHLDFIEVKEQQEFDTAQPVKRAEVYKKPDAYETMKHYAASSGYDFVFLCKSNENSRDIYFN